MTIFCSAHDFFTLKLLFFFRPQEHREVVTPEEFQQWSQLSGQIELLLADKLENFRTHFPFSCPKDDLKVTMKLFILVRRTSR